MHSSGAVIPGTRLWRGARGPGLGAGLCSLSVPPLLPLGIRAGPASPTSFLPHSLWFSPLKPHRSPGCSSNSPGRFPVCCLNLPHLKHKLHKSRDFVLFPVIPSAPKTTSGTEEGLHKSLLNESVMCRSTSSTGKELDKCTLSLLLLVGAPHQIWAYFLKKDSIWRKNILNLF